MTAEQDRVTRAYLLARAKAAMGGSREELILGQRAADYRRAWRLGQRSDRYVETHALRASSRQWDRPRASGRRDWREDRRAA